MVVQKRSWVLALSMAIALLGTSGAVASAHADKYKWNVYNTVCYSDAQKATAWIKEQGTTGATWMRITASFQRYSNGHWRTTRSNYYQNRNQFSNNHNDHTLTWTKAYNYHGNDYYRATRISFLFEWYSDNTRIYWAVSTSGVCYP